MEASHHHRTDESKGRGHPDPAPEGGNTDNEDYFLHPFDDDTLLYDEEEQQKNHGSPSSPREVIMSTSGNGKAMTSVTPDQMRKARSSGMLPLAAPVVRRVSSAGLACVPTSGSGATASASPLSEATENSRTTGVRVPDLRSSPPTAKRPKLVVTSAKTSEQQLQEVDDVTESPPSCVMINVGGRIFATSKTTLTLHSRYFANKLAKYYAGISNANDGGSIQAAPLFVDQDPDVFAVLLAFMRQGFIHQRDLTTSLLAQAEYFGVHKLVKDIKYVAYLNLVSSDDSSLGDNKERICRQFEKKYGGIGSAIRAGILPNAIKSLKKTVVNSQDEEETQIVKEYAQFGVVDHEVMDACEESPDLMYNTYFAGLMVPLRVLDPTVQGSDEGNVRVTVPNVCTFMDCVNWLHEHGFVTNEPHFTEHYQGESIHCAWYSRQVAIKTKISDNSNRPRKTDDCCIIFDSDESNEDETTIALKRQEKERRQFAVMVSAADSTTHIFDVHNIFMESSDDKRNDEGSICMKEKKMINLEMCMPFTSRMMKPADEHGREKMFASNLEAANWLSSHGYNKAEESLGATLHLLLCRRWRVSPDDIRVTILSRARI